MKFGEDLTFIENLTQKKKERKEKTSPTDSDSTLKLIETKLRSHELPSLCFIATGSH